MNLHINHDLSGIEVINSTLNTKKDELTNDRLDKIISNLGRLLNDLESHVKKEAFTPLTEPLKPWISEVLQNLDQTLDLYKDGKLEKIEGIKSKIFTIQSTVKSHPSLLERKIPCHSECVFMTFFCDLDCPDHNGAISEGIKTALAKGVSFITTRSMLQGTGIKEDEEKIIDHILNMQSTLLNYKEKWNIYQKGEMFVFIPKSIFKNKQEHEKLAALDLRSDGTLKKSSVETIFEEVPKKNLIEDFFELFVEPPKGLFIDGHGGANSVASLAKTNYQKLLDFLRPRCKGLAVSCCSAGGTSSLLNIPEMKSGSPAEFLDQVESHPFPVLVRSIGDFTTSSQPAEEELKSFLDEFASFTQGSQTLKQLCQTVEKVEKDKKKAHSNLNKFYPAHSAGIPSGFRPINEGNKGFVITYQSVKKAEIGPVIAKKQEQETFIVNGAEVLEIHPLVTQIPIVVIGKGPILLSMTPGTGHHFIKVIELDKKIGAEPYTFIKNTTLDYRGSNELTNGSKGFFIEKIIGKNRTLTGVVLKISPLGAICVWEEGGSYFLQKDDDCKIEISRFLHGIICRKIADKTVAQKKAIISMSAGQESESSFEEAMGESHVFSTDIVDIFKLDENQFISKMLDEHYKGRKKGNYESGEAAAIFYFLETGDVTRALNLLNEFYFKSKNMQNFDGTPLLFAAIKAKAFDIINCLLKQGVNINELNPAGKTPLQYVLNKLSRAYKEKESIEIEAYEKILDLLLADPSIDLTFGPIFYALDNRKIVEKLIKRGATVDCCKQKENSNSQGHSLLSFVVALQERKNIDLLLELKADPNLGNPSALNQAIADNDLPIVQQLLDAGGTPFVPDNGGKIPFIEAIFYASPEIISLLLKREDCNLEVLSSTGLFPLLAAMITGNKTKIQMLVDNKAAFPTTLSKESEALLKRLLDQYLKARDEKSIQDLLKMDKAPHGFVARYLLHKSELSLLNDLIKSGQIDRSAVAKEDLKILQDLLNYNYPKGKELGYVIERGNCWVLELLLENGFDPNSFVKDRFSQETSLLDIALFEKQPDVLQLLFKYDLSPTLKQSDFIKRALLLAVKIDPAIVQLFMDHGVVYSAKTIRDLLEMKDLHGCIATFLLRKLKLPLLKELIDNHEIDRSAIAKKDLEILEQLEKYDYPQGKDALRNVIEKGNTELMAFLLKNGLDPNSCIKNNDSEMPLVEVALMTSPPQAGILRLLFQYDVSVSLSKITDRETAINRAMETGDDEIVQKLIDHGFDAKISQAAHQLTSNTKMIEI